MIDVEARPEAPPASSPQDDVLPWLAIVAGAFLVDCLPAWERYCTGETARFPERCFTAHVWSGSGRLLGLAAIVTALVFLVATLRVGWRTVPGSLRLAAFAGFVATAAGKAMIVLSNAAKTTAAQSHPSPASPAVWIGLAISVLGGILLLVVLLRDPRRSSKAAVVVTMLVLAVFSVAYARSGFAWWGGPLAQPAFLGGGNGVVMGIEPGRPEFISGGGITLYNGSQTNVTLDGLDVVDASPPFRVLGTYVIRAAPCLPSAVDLGRALLGHECAYPLSGFVLAPGDPANAVELAALVDVSSPGLYRTGWFRVRYHAGPVPFELFRTDQVTLCAPEPGRRSCPGRGL